MIENWDGRPMVCEVLVKTAWWKPAKRHTRVFFTLQERWAAGCDLASSGTRVTIRDITRPRRVETWRTKR